jgi:hypothetical protein
MQRVSIKIERLQMLKSKQGKIKLGDVAGLVAAEVQMTLFHRQQQSGCRLPSSEEVTSVIDDGLQRSRPGLP